MSTELEVQLSVAIASLRASQRRLNAIGDLARLEGAMGLADDLYDAAWRCETVSKRLAGHKNTPEPKFTTAFTAPRRAKLRHHP